MLNDSVLSRTKDGTRRGLDNGIPESVELLQNYPNPFNPETEIRYGLDDLIRVQIRVYDLLGSEVTTLVDQVQPAGYYSVRWSGTATEGTPVSSGVYLYRIIAGNTTIVRKMLFVR